MIAYRSDDQTFRKVLSSLQILRLQGHRFFRPDNSCRNQIINFSNYKGSETVSTNALQGILKKKAKLNRYDKSFLPFTQIGNPFVPSMQTTGSLGLQYVSFPRLYYNSFPETAIRSLNLHISFPIIAIRFLERMNFYINIFLQKTIFSYNIIFQIFRHERLVKMPRCIQKMRKMKNFNLKAGRNQNYLTFYQSVILY